MPDARERERIAVRGRGERRQREKVSSSSSLFIDRSARRAKKPMVSLRLSFSLPSLPWKRFRSFLEASQGTSRPSLPEGGKERWSACLCFLKARESSERARTFPPPSFLLRPRPPPRPFPIPSPPPPPPFPLPLPLLIPNRPHKTRKSTLLNQARSPSSKRTSALPTARAPKRLSRKSSRR